MSNEKDPSARPMVVAVCAYRLENVAKNFRHNISQLSGDEYFVLLDRPKSDEAEEVAEAVRAAGGSMRVLGATNGLSASRNTVLAERPHHHVLFVDDDVRLDAAAVDAVRAAFRGGAQVTGTRLVSPPELARMPWFVTSGQFHLIGWHRPQGEIKIWGACMGVDSAFATAHGLDFDLALSRTGGNLQSGEDTSFIRLMKETGAQERLLPGVAVVHDVDLDRLSLRYLMRRAYWQGRSEVRRASTWSGLRKEWDRHRSAPEAPGRALPLVPVYVGATLWGVAHEYWARFRSRP
ncbi:glycosyl hydrolase [Kitasatospora sp. NPDC048239]|uniref:glycosyl hydrolase n=1 Tax=Kitasatospora sp. NPDC048239 TaxID=3364046 RepID=UPI00371F91E0